MCKIASESIRDTLHKKHTYKVGSAMCIPQLGNWDPCATLCTCPSLADAQLVHRFPFFYRPSAQLPVRACRTTHQNTDRGGGRGVTLEHPAWPDVTSTPKTTHPAYQTKTKPNKQPPSNRIKINPPHRTPTRDPTIPSHPVQLAMLTPPSPA
jgi:hypothetical protein